MRIEYLKTKVIFQNIQRINWDTQNTQKTRRKLQIMSLLVLLSEKSVENRKNSVLTI